MAELIRPFTPIFIYATMDGEAAEEVIRGTVTKWQLVETNREFYLQLEAADEAQALRKNQDEFFFSDDHGSKKILEEILGKWGVPHEIQIQDVKHSKKVYRKKYLCDMIADVLKDLKEKGGGVYFVRAKGGVIQIIPRGTNEIVYHFDTEDNLVRVQESFDVSQIVTRVQVVGKSKEEGHQKIEATVDGHTDFGIRQVIYERADKTTLDEAKTAAKKILDEQGKVKRKTSIESPDIPTVRKGDRIRIHSSTGTGYFFIKSISHNAANQTMRLEIDEDKDKNKELGLVYDTNAADESGTSTPP